MTEWNHIRNWNCNNFSCQNCPYRRRDRCFEKEIQKGDVEITGRYTEIKNWFDKMLHEELRPKCPYCGAKLDHYWYYDYHGGQCQICKKCGKLVKKK